MSRSQPEEHVIGTLTNGATVIYTPPYERETSRTDALGRTVTFHEEAEYVISGDDFEETIPAGGKDEDETQMSEVISDIGDEYEWASLTAEAYVSAYGTISSVGSWPDETRHGDPLVGLVEECIIESWNVHGKHIGLYHTGDQLEPFVVKPSPKPTESVRRVDNPQPIKLPESSLRDEYTFDIPDEQSIEDIVQAFEEDDLWAITGYPHELTENEIVSGQRVQVADEYNDVLLYPRYWTDSGGFKHLIV